MNRCLLTVVLVLTAIIGITTTNPAAHAGTDWNVWTEKGRVTSVYREYDNTSAVVRASVTVATGSEIVTVECDPSDADCDFPLTDPCTSTTIAVGAIDFIDHTFTEETCTAGYGKCLYANGLVTVTPSDGRHNLNAITTTLLALSDCSPR